MLKHKGRERREEKRRENKGGRRSLCWSFGFSFPGQSLQELLQWGTKNAGIGETTAKEGAEPKCASLPGTALAAAGASCALESHTGNGNNCTGRACRENLVETILLKKN